MSRPASRVITTPHPIYPETVRLVQHRKAGRTAIEAQYRIGGKWSGYKAVGQTMRDAVRVSSEAWVMQSAGISTISTARLPVPVRQGGKITPVLKETFAAAANGVIKDIRAELAKKELTVGRRSKKLHTFDDNIRRINRLVEVCGDVPCKDINADFAIKMWANYRNKDGSKPSQSATGSVQCHVQKGPALFCRSGLAQCRLSAEALQKGFGEDAATRGI